MVMFITTSGRFPPPRIPFMTNTYLMIPIYHHTKSKITYGTPKGNSARRTLSHDCLTTNYHFSTASKSDAFTPCISLICRRKLPTLESICWHIGHVVSPRCLYKCWVRPRRKAYLAPQMSHMCGLVCLPENGKRRG